MTTPLQHQGVRRDWAPTSLTRAVLEWGETVDRPLPWRGERDPYRVLVSEVMLQQTQASRVAGAYESFLERFPTRESLAAAPLDDVLREWGTLGYPRRARMLWEAARLGPLPTTVAALEALPGIGPYTARAVAAFCFGVDAAPVEANIRRVWTRVHGLPPDEDVAQLAFDLLPRGRAGVWNQALMDLGATICKPRTPACESCPLEEMCAWRLGVRPGAVRPRRAPPPFETTMRYVRGRVLEHLRRAPATASEIAEVAELEPERVEAAVADLEREGLLSRRGRRLHIGSPR